MELMAPLNNSRADTDLIPINKNQKPRIPKKLQPFPSKSESGDIEIRPNWRSFRAGEI